MCSMLILDKRRSLGLNFNVQSRTLISLTGANRLGGRFLMLGLCTDEPLPLLSPLVGGLA